MHPFFPPTLFAILLLAESSTAGQELIHTKASPQHWSPQELWRGVDVETLPLDVEVLRSWKEDGCDYRKLTYVSEITDGNRIRVFAIQGAPEGAKRLPGILHIHGGGQTASLAWVQYWAKRGYACLTYDFCGPWEGRKEYTDW